MNLLCAHCSVRILLTHLSCSVVGPGATNLQATTWLRLCANSAHDTSPVDSDNMFEERPRCVVVSAAGTYRLICCPQDPISPQCHPQCQTVPAAHTYHVRCSNLLFIRNLTHVWNTVVSARYGLQQHAGGGMSAAGGCVGKPSTSASDVVPYVVV